MNRFANTLIVTGLLTIALLGEGWVIHTILMGTPAPMIGRSGTWVVASAMVVLLCGILFKSGARRSME